MRAFRNGFVVCACFCLLLSAAACAYEWTDYEKGDYRIEGEFGKNRVDRGGSWGGPLKLPKIDVSLQYSPAIDGYRIDDVLYGIPMKGTLTRTWNPDKEDLDNDGYSDTVSTDRSDSENYEHRFRGTLFGREFDFAIGGGFREGSGETVYTVFNGERVEFLDEEGNEEADISRLEDWFLNFLAESNAVGGASGGTPQGANQTVLDYTIDAVLPPVLPRALDARLRQQREAARREQARVVSPEGEVLLAQIPAFMESWDVSNTDSALRYEFTDHDLGEYQSHRIGLSAHANFHWDRVSLDLTLPVDTVIYDPVQVVKHFTRTGLIATPRVYVASQEEQGVDVSLGLNVFYSHTFLWLKAMYDEFEDPDHLGAGPVLTVSRDFEHVSVSGGAIWQRSFNLDGMDEVTGESTIDVLNLGVNVGVPVGERVVVNAQANYRYSFDLPELYDEDYVKVGLGATWMVSDAWTFDARVRTNLGYEDADNVEVSLGAVWVF